MDQPSPFIFHFLYLPEADIGDLLHPIPLHVLLRTMSRVADGLWKFAVPTATALAPASKNSMASSAVKIPPIPITGTLTAWETW